DAASGWILSSIEDNEEIPKASKITEIRADEYEQGFTSMLLLDIAAYAEKYGDKAVRKNLTIPAWLNTIAERENINFSLVLQEALQEKLLVH
ncbi:MAG: HicB family protein, partial [Firmicutes bacterium]|nr:HicB family protein [Bacillota bacterium]